MVDAATALSWGLVNRVVEPDALDAEVDALASQIARSSPEVIALGKRAFYAQEAAAERDAYALTCGVMVENAQLDDAQEGMRAFLEKRTPSWSSGSDP
jgi:enoyl-CoA hydratase/carnithine racemase